ncbi:MAG: hypothetical protein Q7T55_22850 [Solirubrobacteraceae bacterium]|nr:hypothetical protein [Solirubrobacteraceae bacterium]
MGLIVASTLCLVLWLVLWALGIFAARDAGILAFSLFLVAVAVRTVGEQLRAQDTDLG